MPRKEVIKMGGYNLEVALTDGTTLEGKPDNPFDVTTGVGIHLNDVFRTAKRSTAGPVPLALRVFVPYSAILFIVIEQ